MDDHEWRVRRALTVQGITIEAVCAGDQWALRRNGEITARGSFFEVIYAYDVIASTLSPSSPNEQREGRS